MTDRHHDDKPVPVFPEAAEPPDVAAPALPLPEEPADGSRVFIPRWLVIVFIVVALAGVAGSLVRMPYFAIGPGSTKDVLTLIGVSDGARTYPSKGKLLITTAAPSARTLTFWETVVVWLHPSLGTIDAEILQPSGVTGEQQEAENYADIEDSKLDAETLAFRYLGLEVGTSPGAVVLSVVDGSPADGKLRRGDVIVAVDGKRVRAAADAGKRIGTHEPGDPALIVFRRDGKRMEARIAPEAVSPGQPPRVGVFLGPILDLPYDISIKTDEIGGPSGGLVFTLSLIDLLTEEDLTRGHVVAVTGTIDAQGRVGAVGGVDHKTRAAMRDGADVFLVPTADAALARSVARPSLRIVPVDTLDDAVRALRSLPPRS